MSLDPQFAANALGAAGDAIITLDASAKVTSWNDAAERLLGFTREEAFERGARSDHSGRVCAPARRRGSRGDE
jgi:PAS domain S-box-containing protein